MKKENIKLVQELQINSIVAKGYGLLLWLDNINGKDTILRPNGSKIVLSKTLVNNKTLIIEITKLVQNDYPNDIFYI